MQRPDALEPLFTARQVAERYSFTTDSLINARSQGRGPRWIKLPNGRIRYRLSDLIAWEQTSAGPATA